MSRSNTPARLQTNRFFIEQQSRFKTDNLLRIIGVVLLCIGAAIAYREQGNPMDMKPSLTPIILMVAGLGSLITAIVMAKREQ